MRSIDPSPGKIKKLINELPLDKPILMLNLLRFNEQANYPKDGAYPASSGLEAYQIYSDMAFPKIKSVGGSMFWQSQVMATLIAPDDEEWDKAFLVNWPSFQTFLDVIMSPDYQQGTVHRTAALKDARLIMLENK